MTLRRRLRSGEANACVCQPIAWAQTWYEFPKYWARLGFECSHSWVKKSKTKRKCSVVTVTLSSGQFHPILKEAVISPILKKSTLDNNQLSNYRPISNFSLISKIIERVVKPRLTAHLCSNKLLNPHQSAYCKHHSTETALRYIYDHLVNAIVSQKTILLMSS